MPRHYPAMKMQMGSWTYYTVKMNLGDVASEIKFASEVNDDSTLDGAIQREINESRAKKGIVNFLSSNEDRFFSSLVVAALGGNPEFWPVDISNDPQFRMVQRDANNTFGMLTFDDSIQTYALDGQHRLFAIKELIENNQTMAPPGFSQETISVIFVTPRDGDSLETFKKSYRGLFSALNRHAKPTTKVTNIIMDEIDRFARVTRRIVTDYEFFQWDGQGENAKVDTNNTESINGVKPFFCTLVGLYKMNTRLIWDSEHDLRHGQMSTSLKDLIQDDISEEETDALYEYLERIWDSLLLVLPDLENDPKKMRVFDASGDGDLQNHGLFRPLIQTEILAPLARRLMNEAADPINTWSTAEEIQIALKPLSKIDWKLNSDFWRNFLISENHQGVWTIANEDRVKRVKLANNILAWVVGIEDLNDDHLDEFKAEWSSYLGSTEDPVERESVFDELEILRNQILSE